MQFGSAAKLSLHRLTGALLLASGIALLCGAEIVARPGRNPVVPKPSAATPTSSQDSARRASIEKSFGQLPLSFEANRGQTDPSVRYLAHGGAFSVFLTDDGAVLALSRQDTTPGVMRGSTDPRASLKMLAGAKRTIHTAGLKLAFEGMNPKPAVEASDRLPGTTNYLLGRDSSRWHRNISNFARVEYRSIYPGIDLAFYGNRGRLEYDIDVAAGANPDRVRMKIEGADHLGLDREGNLVATVAGERAVLGRPIAYQQAGGSRRSVAANFVLHGKSDVTLALGQYDRREPLVIDPAIMYSTFLGGTVAEIQSLAVDPAGNAYVAGWTCCGSNLPVVGGVQSTLNGADNAFVAKLNPTGTSFIYSTYLGGGQMDVATGVAFDSAGNAYVSGFTDSPDFPVQPGGSSLSGGFDAFISALNPAGNGLLYSQYVGGAADDLGNGVAVEPTGTAYLVGQTFSTDFPTTASNAYQTANPSGGAVSAGFIARFDPPQNGGGAPNMSYSSYFGGPAPTNSTPSGVTFLNGVAYYGVPGRVYFAGAGGGATPVTIPQFGGMIDAVVGSFDTTQTAASSLIFSRFIGGSSIDVATAIATTNGCTSLCPAVVSGYTFSADIPGSILIFGGAEDGFIAKIDPANGINNFSYVGTSGYDEASGANLTSSGIQTVGGTTFRPIEFIESQQLQPTPAISGQVFISSDQGGTINAASNWKPDFGSLSPQAIAVDTSVPTNQIQTGEIIYLGTNSEGLFRSTDNGATYQSIGSFGATQVSSVTVAKALAQGPLPMYVTTKNLLFESIDGGDNFAQLSALPAVGGLPSNANWVGSDFTFGQLTGTINSNALVWQGNKNGLYVSTNEGVTFTPSTGIAAQGQVTQVFSGVNDIFHEILYIGTDKGIFRSSDFGFTFVPTVVNSSVIFSMAIDTTTTPPTVYAGTIGDGVYSSTDGFATQQHLTHTVVEPNGRFHYVTVDDLTTNPAIVYLGLGDTQRFGTLWKSTNAGASFARLGGSSFNQPCCMFPLVVGNGTLYASDYEESDGFFFQLAKLGNALQFASPLGGGSYDEVTGVGTDSANNVYMAGLTFSSDYPSLNAAQKTLGGGSSGALVNGFATKIGFTSNAILSAPKQLAFPGKIRLRNPSKPLTVVLSNTGTDPLYLGYVHVEAGNASDFFTVPGIAPKTKRPKGSKTPITVCGTTIPPGTSCGISLEFQPFGVGNRAALFLLPSNSSNGTQQVLLTGKGKKPPKGK